MGQWGIILGWIVGSCRAEVISRNWSNFDAAQYELELSATELATTLSDDVDYLFSLYNMTLTELIDKHATQRKTVRKKQHHAS